MSQLWKKSQFTCIENLTLDDPDFKKLQPISRLCYLYVAKYRNSKTHECWPGQLTLADDLGVSLRTVKRCISELLTSGFLELARVEGRNNVYRFPKGRALVGSVQEPADEYTKDGVSWPVGVSDTVGTIPNGNGDTDGPMLEDGDTAGTIPQTKPGNSDTVGTIEKSNGVTYDPNRMDLEALEHCQDRLSRKMYAGFVTKEGLLAMGSALAIWFDTFASRNQRLPTISNWGAVGKASKELIAIASNNDPANAIDWMIRYFRAAFDLAEAKTFPFTSGPGALDPMQAIQQRAVNLVIAKMSEGDSVPGQFKSIRPIVGTAHA